MYRKFYELDADPFCLDPNLDFLYISHAHEEAVSHIAYGLEQEEAIILITGDIGTGKTVALHRVVAQLSGTFVPVMINVTTLDFLQFLRLVMFKLGDADPAPDLSGLIHGFEALLLAMRGKGKKILLIVDEAQNCSTEVLESIRLLLNLAQPGGQVLQLVLAGQIGLEEKLAQADLRQFRQRIRVAYRLECLNRRELEAYVVHRLKVAGRVKRLFDASALDRIYWLSGGVPRLVNQFADRALLAGFVANAGTIMAAHVEDSGEDAPASVPSPSIESANAGPADNVPQTSAPALPPRSVDSATVPAAAAAERRGAAARPQFAERRSRPRDRRALWIAVTVIGLATAGYFVLRTSTAGAPDAGIGRVIEPQSAPANPASEPFDTSAGAAIAPVDSLRAAVADTPSVSRASIAGSAVIEAAVPSDTVAARALQNRPDPGAVAPDAVAQSAPTIPSVTMQADTSQVSVHVYSFRTADRAHNSRSRLLQAGIPTFILHEQGAHGTAWYRVYMGPFAGRSLAEHMVDSLRTAGIVEYASISRRTPAEP